MMKKINALNMDYQTYSKVKGKLNQDDRKNVTITDEKPSSTSQPSSSSSSSMSTQMEEVSKDNSNLIYVSNVKDSKSGEVSEPFEMNGGKYQMVRAKDSKGKIVLGVYSFNDKNEKDENIIYPIDYFEKNIAKKEKEETEKVDEYDYAGEEIAIKNKEGLMDYLNLADLIGYKHFFVNISNGNVSNKFKSTREMMKSGIKLGPNEDYMDEKDLKRFRFGNYFKNEMNETELAPEDANTNIPKLQADVKKLANLIKTKFSIYLSKLNKPIEQAQFLTAMAKEIGVPLNKLNSIITSYKDIAAQDVKPNLAERKIVKKKDIEKDMLKKELRIIKIKE